MSEDKGYLVAHMDDIEPSRSTCGSSRRAFITPGNDAASVHRLDLQANAEPHYHGSMTEIYYILEGEGFVELNGEDVPVKPGTAVLIKPGTRHRGKGKMQLLVICTPPFDKGDEYFD
jgi:mannose-6-phosphate isomerase-like protein (cupin superfamily)